MVFGGLLWMTMWVAVIYFIVKAVGASRDSTPVAWPQDSALEIARRRYASGEITKDELEELRSDLTSKAA
jgi:putative membrane protein